MTYTNPKDLVTYAEGRTVIIFKPLETFDKLIGDIIYSAKNNLQFITETNDEWLFHRLRLEYAKNPDMFNNISVLFQNNEGEVQEVSLKEEDEFNWPKEMIHDGIELELEIRKAQSGVIDND